jgi:hypothetical protein
MKLNEYRKKRHFDATPEPAARDVTQEEPRSVASHRLLEEIARDEGGDMPHRGGK